MCGETEFINLSQTLPTFVKVIYPQGILLPRLATLKSLTSFFNDHKHLYILLLLPNYAGRIIFVCNNIINRPVFQAGFFILKSIRYEARI